MKPFHMNAFWDISYGLLLIHALLFVFVALYVGLEFLNEVFDVSDRQGKVASVFYGISGLFIMKNSAVTFLTGCSYESQVKLHWLLAIYGFILGCFHGFRIVGKTQFSFSKKRTSGYLLLLAVLIITLLAILFKFVKGYYAWFINIHRLLYVLIIVCAILHKSWDILYIGLIPVVFDVIVRIVYSWVNRKNLIHPHLVNIGDEYVSIKFLKSSSFKYKPG